MKKHGTIFILGLLFAFSAFSQKTAFVNVQYVLSKVPEYEAAQVKLNELAKTYQKEIADKKAEIAKLYASYQADKILLSQEMREKKESAIKTAEEELDLLKAKRFGANGDLHKERQKLVKPIQDKVYSAIQDVADSKNFNLVLDVSSKAGVLYYNEKYDKTEDVLKKMGYL